MSSFTVTYDAAENRTYNFGGNLGGPKLVLGISGIPEWGVFRALLQLEGRYPHAAVDLQRKVIHMLVNDPEEYTTFSVLFLKSYKSFTDEEISAAAESIDFLCDFLNVSSSVNEDKISPLDFSRSQGIINYTSFIYDPDETGISMKDFSKIGTALLLLREEQSSVEEEEDEVEEEEDDEDEIEDDDSVEPEEFTRPAKKGSQARYIPYLRALMGLPDGTTLDDEMLEAVAALQEEHMLENTTGEIDEETYDLIVEIYG